ncbi:gastrula zinc finger protein XlCGF58.1 [Drosophila guanche]|uniref:Blast:Zinc finger protein 175 n=1 Tax=Drosophila guanche TaxID=7266 RepID=A0A3B0JGG1_DROGU|nr:gastrula zinc finger protein XlCGF58.1 [Drosophila guanche]SPP81437.1 blast:Zinc finger protein 175 [Drosophila guanche]
MLLAPAAQSQPTLHQPLHSKVSNYLNNQRRTGEFCDLLLELDSADDALSLSVHFCVLAAQSQLIATNQKQQQFSIHNPLKITIRNFACTQCLHTIVDFFYEDIVSVSKDHEQHFRELAKILAVTELLNLYQMQPADEARETCEATTPGDAEGNLEPTKKPEDLFENQQSIFKLKNPRAVKSSSKVNYCIGCDFKCYQVQKMIEHMSSCEPSHLTCSLCEVGFLDWREYDRHLRRHSGNPRKPFFCLQCGIHFTTRAALLVHQPKHSTETPHICPHCGKGFKWKQGLSNHILVHNPEKQMLCDVCGYSTTHMKALKSHKLLHTGEFFACTVSGCNHVSNRKENMKLHIETHKQGRDFICEICGCNFSQSKNLKRHALKHTENGPSRYKCQLCSFSSHRSDKMKEHVQRVHTEKAVQLELSESVDSSFENKMPDDFDLPMIEDTLPPVRKKQREPKGSRKQTVEGTPSIEKRLKMLLPKENVK